MLLQEGDISLVETASRKTVLKMICRDVRRIFNELNLYHVTVGSTAVAASMPSLLIVPHDVDIWYDASDVSGVVDGFTSLGYSYTVETSPVFAPLDVFHKDGMRVDLRRGYKVSKGFRYNFFAQFINFFYPESMMMFRVRQFEGQEILTPPVESLYLQTLFASALRGESDAEFAQRRSQSEALGHYSDQKVIDKIFHDRPGLYLGTIPLITFSSVGTINLFKTVMQQSKKVV